MQATGGRVRGVVSLLLVVLALSACLRIEQKLTVDGDGSVETESLFVADPEVAFEAFSGQQVLFNTSPGYDRGEMCDAIQQAERLDFPDATTERAEDDGWCGIRVRQSIGPTQDRTALLDDFFDDEDGVLERVGDNWVFEVEPNLGLAEDLPEDPLERRDAIRRFEDASWTIEVDLPGTAVDGANNATSVSGGRFTWELDMLDPPTRLFAETEPAPPIWTSRTLIGVAVALFVGLLALAGFVVGGRKPKRGASGMTEPTADAEQPYFDDAFGVWVRNDAVHGRLWHDTKNDRWVPF